MDIDLAAMTFVAFYPESAPKPNVLLVKHPQIGNMLLRFNNDKTQQDTIAAWLKVLTSWGPDREKNRIYIHLPSNYSFALFNVLHALYAHPDVLKTEGIL